MDIANDVYDFMEFVLFQKKLIEDYPFLKRFLSDKDFNFSFSIKKINEYFKRKVFDENENLTSEKIKSFLEIYRKEKPEDFI